MSKEVNPSDKSSVHSLPEKPNHRELWNELVKETDDLKKEVNEYKLARNPVLEPPPHPEVDYLNNNIFPVLNMALIQMLKKVKDQETTVFTEGDEYLNSLNFIAEFIWNMNPLHPERKDDWMEISKVYGRNRL